MRRGQRGNNAACSALDPLSDTSPKRLAPFQVLPWCRILDGWAGVRSRTLWALLLQWTLLRDWQFLPLPQLHRILQPEVLRLYFPAVGTLGCTVCLVPPLFLLVFICMQMWDRPVHQPPPHRPGCPSPPLLPVWMSVSSFTPWLRDFPTVRFPGSSGCVLFLNWLLSFFWLCEEAKRFIYLHLHFGQNFLNRNGF